MTIFTNTIRPGLLVSLKTSIKGNVTYTKTDLQADTPDADADEEGSQGLIARWETERRIADAAEHELSAEVRGKARSLISAVCAKSAFGLLCPDNKTAQLSEAVQQAQQLVANFNASAKLTKIELYIIAGRIAQDDVQAVQAISSEVRDLLSTIEKGLANLDVKAVREAAAKAKSIGQVLSPAAQSRVQDAIDIARSAARKIVSAGEQAATEIDREAIAAIAKTRTAFLDLGDQVEVAAPAAEGRGVDFEPSEEITAPAHVAPKIELDETNGAPA